VHFYQCRNQTFQPPFVDSLRIDADFRRERDFAEIDA
jgi:hypothetical protein